MSLVSQGVDVRGLCWPVTWGRGHQAQIAPVLLVRCRRTSAGTSGGTRAQAMVARYLTVECAGFAPDGAPLRFKASGWKARILQHEVRAQRRPPGGVILQLVSGQHRGHALPLTAKPLNNVVSFLQVCLHVDWFIYRSGGPMHAAGGPRAGAAVCGPHGGLHIPCVGCSARRAARRPADAAGDWGLHVQPQVVNPAHARERGLLGLRGAAVGAQRAEVQAALYSAWGLPGYPLPDMAPRQAYSAPVLQRAAVGRGYKVHL